MEVFGGGGTMMLNKERSVKEILNDRNGNLVNLYRVVREQPDELKERLTYVLNSRADYILTKEQIEHGVYHDRVQWAADFYQLKVIQYHAFRPTNSQLIAIWNCENRDNICYI